MKTAKEKLGQNIEISNTGMTVLAYTIALFGVAAGFMYYDSSGGFSYRGNPAAAWLAFGVALSSLITAAVIVYLGAIRAELRIIRKLLTMQVTDEQPDFTPDLKPDSNFKSEFDADSKSG